MNVSCEIAAVTPARLYVLPHPALRNVISHYTVYAPQKNVVAPDTRNQLHLVPDASGCIVCPVTGSGCVPLFWGPSSQVTTVQDPPGDNPALIMVEFLPAGAHRVLGVPMHPFENIVLPLSDLDARLAAALRECIHHIQCSGENKEYLALFHAFDRLFLSRLEQTENSPLSGYLLASLTETRGTARVKELSRRTGYTTRHLNRIVGEKLGLSIKLLSRIIQDKQRLSRHVLQRRVSHRAGA